MTRVSTSAQDNSSGNGASASPSVPVASASGIEKKGMLTNRMPSTAKPRRTSSVMIRSRAGIGPSPSASPSALRVMNSIGPRSSSRT